MNHDMLYLFRLVFLISYTYVHVYFVVVNGRKTSLSVQIYTNVTSFVFISLIKYPSLVCPFPNKCHPSILCFCYFSFISLICLFLKYLSVYHWHLSVCPGRRGRNIWVGSRVPPPLETQNVNTSIPWHLFHTGVEKGGCHAVLPPPPYVSIQAEGGGYYSKGGMTPHEKC